MTEDHDNTGPDGADQGLEEVPATPEAPGGRGSIDPFAGAAPVPPPPPGYAAYAAPPAPAKRGGGVLGRIIGGLIGTVLLISILGNFYLGAYFIATTSGPSETDYRDGDRDKRIVILPIKDVIDEQMAQFVRRAMHELRQDPPKAIILRVESPGGGVSASDRIWHLFKEFRKDHKNIPMVASFGAIATSGGYYVAVPADFIYAEPTTITGSIGVIAQGFTVGELLDKIGVTPETIVATDATEKDLLNPYRNWNDKDRSEIRGLLDRMHERFVHVVFDGRQKHLTEKQVKELATGKIYMTKEAIEAKLIDAEGYLEAAIDKASKLAKVENPLVTIIHPARGQGWLGLLGAAPRRSDSITAQQIRRMMDELSAPRLEYRMPPLSRPR